MMCNHNVMFLDFEAISSPSHVSSLGLSHGRFRIQIAGVFPKNIGTETGKHAMKNHENLGEHKHKDLGSIQPSPKKCIS